MSSRVRNRGASLYNIVQGAATGGAAGSGAATMRLFACVVPGAGAGMGGMSMLTDHTPPGSSTSWPGRTAWSRRPSHNVAPLSSRVSVNDRASPPSSSVASIHFFRFALVFAATQCSDVVIPLLIFLWSHFCERGY